MKVYFIRHGESEYNVDGLMNSDKKVNVHLTALGRKQAERVGRRLKAENIDVIFSSEFLRAKETARIINRELNVRINFDKKLNEIRQGFEGETSDKFWKAARKYNDFLKFNLKWKESFLDVKKRVERFLSGLKKKKFERVLVVSHESVLMAVRAISGELDDKEAFSNSIGNCRIVEIEI